MAAPAAATARPRARRSVGLLSGAAKPRQIIRGSIFLSVSSCMMSPEADSAGGGPSASSCRCGLGTSRGFADEQAPPSFPATNLAETTILCFLLLETDQTVEVFSLASTSVTK